MNKKSKIYIIISWTLVLLWMGVIFAFSSQLATDSGHLSNGITKFIIGIIKKILPGDSFDIRLFEHYVRKLAHFTVYFVLGIFTMNAFSTIKIKGKKQIVYVLVLCALYALTDEFHQIFVPGRGPAIKDVLIDTGGAGFGILVYIIIYKIMILKARPKIM
ncbi:VanZ family protein [Helicovermis profundi]|uniref:VanZ family protein n=1 Tax=Helicovermis profundi TaxID=3065157 RepID=A0AAU9E6H5_9FIRM|nr:VanZ family protein [Clostridia bacterium S502]